MSGIWEISRKPSVLVAILNAKDIVPAKWALHFRNLILPNDGSHPRMYSGMSYQHARNMAATQALEGGFTWLYFCDDDTCMPSDSFLKLSAHSYDIVSGLYYRRHPPIDAMMLRDTPQGPGWIKEFQMGQVINVDYVGGGCLLIHRRVLEALEKPMGRKWFRWRLEDSEPDDLFPGIKLSEDFYFSKAARVLGGFKIYVDTSVQCLHIGMGEAQVGGAFVPATL